jgi:hypothetical protein
MTQIHVINAYSGKLFAEACVHGLQREGYQVYWEADSNTMSSRALDRAERDTVVVFWTRDNVYSKWVVESAQKAQARDALIEITLDPVASPIDGTRRAPLDFANWDGAPAGALWQSFMQLVLATAGRPTGDLPLKEVAPPALWISGLAVAAATTLAIGGLPNTRAPNDSYALAPTPIDQTEMGGPTATSRAQFEAPLAAPADAAPMVTARFEKMEAAPSVLIVPIKAFEPSEITTDIASADPASDSSAETPNS